MAGWHFTNDAGLKHGLSVEYFDDGTVRKRLTYSNGLKHGPCTWYRDNRLWHDTYTYRHGVMHGPFTSYLADGTVTERGTYVDGWLSGWRFMYHDDGTPKSEAYFIDGQIHGAHVQYELRTSWFGTTDETRGRSVRREEHDAEMRAFRPKLLMEFVIPWLIVARRMGLSVDIRRLIGEMLFDESDLETVYWYHWVCGFNHDE
jgi:hypothetical protein